MASDRRNRAKAEMVRIRIRRMVEEGRSLASIAKFVGKSYRHVKQIAEQEKAVDQEQ